MWRDDYDREEQSGRRARGDWEREQDELRSRGREYGSSGRTRHEEEERWPEDRGRRGGRSGSEAYREEVWEGRTGREGFSASSGTPYTSQADGGGRTSRGFEESGSGLGAEDRGGRWAGGQPSGPYRDYGPTMGDYGRENLYSSGHRQDFTGRGPKSWKRSDQRIEEDLNEQLTRHRDLDATEIEVKVHNGEVTLSGTVNDRQSKRLAEDIAENVSGVHNVQNQIRVSQQAAAYGTSSQSGDARSRGTKTAM